MEVEPTSHIAHHCAFHFVGRHTLGQGWNRGDVFGICDRNRIPLKNLLKKNSIYGSSKLRPRLIAEGLLDNECAKCGLSKEWQGEPITLHLDHINGVSTDNRLKNLRLLCPNCHSQTPTYSRKKQGKEQGKKW